MGDNTSMIEVVLTCKDLATAVDFYTENLGFRIDTIFPADAPRAAILSGFGIKASLLSEEYKLDVQVDVPVDDLTLTVTQIDDGSFGEGRARMQYRDLLPDRYGGRFIASHIRIPRGGPVPDYVHHHNVGFQMIFCINGWVRVVYEDQGQPIVMERGDCLLQPPHIRHQVLECSDMMEVVEIACPAEHETSVDHEMQLPTSILRPDRDFGGQHFVFYEAKNASWTHSDWDGFEYCDTGIEEAAGGTASAVVIRATGKSKEIRLSHNAQIRFLFILGGTAMLKSEKQYRLGARDACTIPPGKSGELRDISADFEYLEVTLLTQ